MSNNKIIIHQENTRLNEDTRRNTIILYDKGPKGDTGPKASLSESYVAFGDNQNLVSGNPNFKYNPSSSHLYITGSLTVSGSSTFTNIGRAEFTGSVHGVGFSGSFSGSFQGDGGGLTNIPAASVVGLVLSQISSGSVSASIDPNTGLGINSSVNISDDLTVSNDLIFADTGLSRVGIGATTPSHKLDVSGSGRFTDGLSVTGSLTVSGSSTLTNYGPAYFMDGNVGIGTTSPSYKLDVSGSGRFTNGLNITGSLISPSITSSLFGTSSWAENAITASYVATASYVPTFQEVTNTGNTTTNDIAVTGSIQQSGSDSYFLGNVGIGTTSPSHKLDVSGSGRFTDGLSVTGSLTVSGSSTLTNYGPAYFMDGNVGIGTTSPSYMLDVVGTGGTNGVIRSRRMIARGGTVTDPAITTVSTIAGLYEPSYAILGIVSRGQEVIRLVNNPQNDMLALIGTTTGTARLQVKGFGNTSASASLLVENADSTTSLAVLDNGNVGIGTTSPSYKLDVSGSGRFTDELSVTGDLTVDGIITAKEFHTEFVSSSIIYQSGSTKFGDTSDDIHQFTGSVFLSSSLLDIRGGDIAIRPPNGIGGVTIQNNTHLDIKPSNNYGVVVRNSSGNGYLSMGMPTSTRGRIRVAETDGISLDSTGQIGIGKQIPTVDIDLEGQTYISGSLYASGALAAFRTNDIYFNNPAGNTRFKFNTENAYWIGAGGYAVYQPYSPANANHNFNIGHASLGSFNWYAGTGNFDGSGFLMTLTRDPRLGIGINQPQYTLDVSGSLRVKNNGYGLEVTEVGTATITTTAGNNGLYINDDSYSILKLGDYRLIQGRVNGTLAIRDSADEEVLFMASGSKNIGLGTTSPSAKLEIQSPTVPTLMLRKEGHTGYALISGSSDLGFEFKTYNNGVVDAMKITNDGKVGIGTIDPHTSLHVLGNGITCEAGGNAVINIVRGNNPGYSSMVAWRTGNSTRWRAGMTDTGDNPDYTGYDFMIGQTKGNPSIFIDTSDNVGIGTTSPSYKLDVSGSGRFTNGLTVTGSINQTGDLTVDGILTAREFHTEFVSASIIHESGSTKFGDSNDDRHDFTGSVHVSDNIIVSKAGEYYVKGAIGRKPIRLYTDGTDKGAISLERDGIIQTLLSSGEDAFGPTYIGRNNRIGLGAVTNPQSIVHVSQSRSNPPHGNILRIDSDMYKNILTVKSSSAVGIGTASPSSKLHVSGSGGGSDVLLVEPAGAPAISLKSDPTLTDYSGLYIGNKYLLLTKNSSTVFQNIQGGLRFSNGYAAKSVITENGYFGIGFNTTTGIDYPLDVKGDARISGSGIFTDGLEVTGSINQTGDLTVDGIITAKEFHTEFVSSSIIYESGSTKFGDTSDDIHQFTGSLQVLGAINRPFSLTNGRAFHKGESGGWRLEYGFKGSSGTDRGGFGAEGANDTVTYYYIGSNQTNPTLTATPAGNVGIGTTSPAATLHIKSPSNFTDTGSLQIDTTGVSSTQVFMDLKGTSGGDQYIFKHYRASTLQNWIRDDQGRLQFYTKPLFSYLGSTAFGFYADAAVTGNVISFGNLSTTHMVVSASGNVGIGTTSPSYKLDVSGSGRFTNGLTVTGSINQTGDLTVDGILTAREFHTEFISSSIIYESGSTKFGDTSDDVHQFTGSVDVSGSIKMTNDGHSYTYPLEITSDSIKLPSNSTTSYSLLRQADGTGAFLSLRNSSGNENAMIRSYNSNGIQAFFTAGKVGIGTASPSSKLHVSGSSDVFLVEGSGSTLMSVDGVNGRLFEVTDDLSDSLFSVNTIAGLPVLEVFADNTVKMGAFNQSDLVVTGSNVGIGTDAPSYKLDLSGSMNHAGASYIVPATTTGGSGDTTILTGSTFDNATLIKASHNNIATGNYTLELPSASLSINRSIRIISDSSTDSNHNINIIPAGSETLDGSTSGFTINRNYEGFMVWSDGTEWFIIQSKNV